MRTRSKSTILAIDPGTRAMGVAVVENGDLIYHGVRTIPKQPSPRDTLDRGRKAVLRLIRDFRPNVLALEKTFFHFTTQYHGFRNPLLSSHSITSAPSK